MTGTKKISVLVSYPDYHFEVVEIELDLEPFQKIVGGYIEAVPRPSSGSGWFAYCNEVGKYEGLPVNYASGDFLDKLYMSEGLPPFTHFSSAPGNVIWFTDSADDNGDEASLPVEYVQRYAATHIEAAWKRFVSDRVITVVRDGADITVFDQRTGALIPQLVASLVRTARSRPEHGTIEVWCMTPDKWVELRVEIMDQIGIALHDERDDKSFG